MVSQLLTANARLPKLQPLLLRCPTEPGDRARPILREDLACWGIRALPPNEEGGLPGVLVRNPGTPLEAP